MSNPLFIGIDLNGGYGTAMSLQLIAVGKRHCRLLYIIPALSPHAGKVPHQ